MGKCFNYIGGYTTGGQPIMRRQCYCGTTACQQTGMIKLVSIGLSKDYPDPDIDKAIQDRNYRTFGESLEEQGRKY